MLRKWAIVVVLVAIAGLGCNRGGSGGGSGAGGKLKFVYIPKSSGNAYFDEIVRGFNDACKENGFQGDVSAPATSDADSQIPIVKQQIQRGVDVILISPNSVDAVNAALDDARKKGIVVIAVDSDLTGNESHRDAAVAPADPEAVAKNQVEEMGSLIGYTGNFAILSATPDAPNQNAWIAAMKDVLKDPKYSKMNLVETVYGDDKPDKSATECEALLTKHPDLAGIDAPTSVGLAAAAHVLQLRGVYPGGPHAVGKGIQLTGLSTPNQLRADVEAGRVTSFSLWAPYDQGYLATIIGMQIKNDNLKPAEGVEFDAGKLGKRKFGHQNSVVAGDMVTFDKNTIGKYHF